MKITLFELKKIIRKIIKEENQQFIPIFNDRLIIDKPDRAFVGVDHGITPHLLDDEIKKIKEIGNTYGYWYEGNGGDIDIVQHLFTKKDKKNKEIEYEGSWDDKISNIESRYPYVYIYTLFANTYENKTLDKINRSNGKTVFDKIMNCYTEWTHEKLKTKSKKEISSLLKKFIKELGTDYYSDLKKEGTEENINNFILSIENDMWDNWPDGDNPAAKLAFRANSERDQHLINTIDKGVIFIGRGHLVLLEKLLTII